MKIGILGGGITGLTAAYTLSKNGHEVIIFETEETMGGPARGFKHGSWEWPLEKAYHHIFASDSDIIQFAKEIGYDGIYFKTPKTNSLYKEGDSFRIIPVDSPIDFLKFPFMTMPQKIRAAFWLGVLKFFPMMPLYENITAEDFVRKFMGDSMWETFFEQLFRKKFGKYSGKVLASFLWARIFKRTKKLGYMKGGFQAFIDHLVDENIKNGVTIKAGEVVKELLPVKNSKNSGVLVNGIHFDKVISTLPSKILAKLGENIFPKNYTDRLDDMNYLHARVVILETNTPILKNTYWLNICTPDVPTMIIAQHTNFVDPKHYGGNHLTYVGYYLEREDEFMQMTSKDIIKTLLPHLKAIEHTDFEILNTFDFKGPFAQPIFDKKLLKNKPDMSSPHDDVYIANLDMTYPFDRGTNYAVKLGLKVSKMLLEQ